MTYNKKNIQNKIMELCNTKPYYFSGPS